jgi:putative ABC transport system ATP-binding protein
MWLFLQQSTKATIRPLKVKETGNLECQVWEAAQCLSVNNPELRNASNIVILIEAKNPVGRATCFGILRLRLRMTAGQALLGTGPFFVFLQKMDLSLIIRELFPFRNSRLIMIIEVRNIIKTYRTRPLKHSAQAIETEVLKDISFSVATGEFVAIMGPSGSGKSTLMHILGCLDAPTNGQYLFDGQDVSQLSDDELANIRRNKIGFVFQSFNLLPRANVLRNVMLPLVYSGVPAGEREKRARAALQSSGLDESHFEHLSNQLSGGQMQRVAIARALVNNPSLILADEPTGNLDTKTGELVMQTFQRLHKEQKRTIVLITHEEYIAKKAERIVHLRDGKIQL